MVILWIYRTKNMKFLTITKWEFKGTISSKKFLMIFFLQLSVLFLMIIMFNFLVTNLESSNGLSITPSLTGFASLDVEDASGLFQKSINPEIIDLTSSNYSNAIKRINQGQTTGFLQLPADTDSRIGRMEPVNLKLYLDYSDPKHAVVRDEVSSTAKLVGDALTASWVGSLNPQNTSEPKFTQKSTGESLPMQIINKVMLAVLLFLPLFLFGNMIIDSVVGEKERKTGEILIATPLSQTQIIMGKSMAVVFTIALQVAMWIIILLIAGFQIKNPLLVYIFVVLTSIPIVGITTIVATYAKNFKEAGIALSFMYIGIVGFLVVPALAYISRKSAAANISPMTIVMRLFSGESIPPGDYLIAISGIVFLSTAFYWVAIKLFKRDDVVFGPRPGILRLLRDLVT
jgi:ABC-2 type transport system permease protein